MRYVNMLIGLIGLVMGATIYDIGPPVACDEARPHSHATIVLVVDDERSMLAMVQDIREDEGYCVLTASEGREALKLATEVCPDLIITDLMMPQMSGRVLRRILSSIPLTSDIPIMLMTAAYRPELDDHFAAVVAKPFHIDDFLQDVQRCTPSSDESSAEQ
jgi:CheY-like chemotaxis protein